MRLSLLLIAFLALTPPLRAQDDRISRVLFSTAQLGNLLFPKDPRTVQIVVEARRTLPPGARTIDCDVRDYWGAEQTEPVQLKLADGESKPGRVLYTGTLDLAGATLEIGRYYEIHVAVPAEKGEPFRAQTSFAILPAAEAKKYKPEEIPFTSRSWDNRLLEHVRLTDRLGLRLCGLSGTWAARAPYAAQVPQLDLVKQLGLGWLTVTPVAEMEAGKAVYDETALRQGVRNLITQFGAVRPMVLNLGNDPRGTGDRVLKNVAAYRAVYEAAKKTDPAITVVATAVEPNEEYFKAGYGQWCDAFDFHDYDKTPDTVRRTIGEYRALMKKYQCEKPIWCTELGFNSQGRTRLAAAAALTKKFTVFFAAGGARAGWFGLLSPDPEGKTSGSATDALNVFDGRYNRYAPRLDAIAYFNAVNAIAIKKFVEEKAYANGVHAFLFRDPDARSLQVLWSDQGRQEIGLPLAGVQEVQVIRIDGSLHKLQADNTDLSLSVSDEPLLLLYQGGGALPAKLDVSFVTLEPLPKTLSRNESSALTIFTRSFPLEGVDLIVPPSWKWESKGLQFNVTPPAGTAAREADFTLTLTDAKGLRRGELYAHAPLE
ncbi:MAG TPA: hypothetical protein VGO11_17080 [Chthoniobacteraceae bacterium]|jgi:hypothetical protein|nr:hypothetical protein [Chthoniobacteraceae bacterium]